MNRVKVGFFSLSDRGGSDDDPDDRAYLAWHQLDHMPEQYQLPGMIHGQRWVSNRACCAARSTATGGFEHVHHVVDRDPAEKGASAASRGTFPGGSSVRCGSWR